MPRYLVASFGFRTATVLFCRIIVDGFLFGLMTIAVDFCVFISMSLIWKNSIVKSSILCILFLDGAHQIVSSTNAQVLMCVFIVPLLLSFGWFFQLVVIGYSSSVRCLLISARSGS